MCVAYELGGDMGLRFVFALLSKLYDRNLATWGFHSSWVWCWNDTFSYPDFLRERGAVGTSRSDWPLTQCHPTRTQLSPTPLRKP